MQVFKHGQHYITLSKITFKKGLRILVVDDTMDSFPTVKNIVYRKIFDTIN